MAAARSGKGVRGRWMAVHTRFLMLLHRRGDTFGPSRVVDLRFLHHQRAASKAALVLLRCQHPQSGLNRDVAAQLPSHTFRGLPTARKEPGNHQKKRKNRQSLTPKMLRALSNQGRAGQRTRQTSSATGTGHTHPGTSPGWGRWGRRGSRGRGPAVSPVTEKEKATSPRRTGL